MSEINSGHIIEIIKKYFAMGRNQSPKVVVAIHKQSHTVYLSKILKILSNEGINHISFLALNHMVSIPGALRKKSMDIWEVVKDRDYEDLDITAMRLAAEWYISDEGNDFTLYNDISLGSLIQREVTYLFSMALKCIAEINAIKERLPADIIFFLTDKGPKTTSIMLERDEDLHCRFAELLLKDERPVAARIEIPGKTNPTKRINKIYFKNFARDIVRLLSACHTKRLSGGKNRKNILFSSFAFLGENFASGLLSGDECKIALLTEQVSVRNYIDSWFNGGISYHYIGQYENAATKRLQEEAKEVLGSKIPYINKTSCYRKNSIIFDGLSEKFEYIFTRRFPMLVRNSSIIKDFLKKRQIHAIAVAVDVCEYEKTIVSVANNQGIPSLVIQHGVSGHPIAFLPLSATRIALWGDITKDWFVRNGVSEDRLEITGTPRFDGHITRTKKMAREDRCSYLKSIGLDPDKRTIVFTPQPTDRNLFANYNWSFNDLKKGLLACADAVKGVSDEQLVIKLKPGNSDNIYISEFIKDRAGNIKVIERTDITSLLYSCDCVITSWSTVGLEAMIVGRPVICVDIGGKGGDAIKNYIESNAVLRVRELAELRSALNAVFNDDMKRLEMIQKGYGFCDNYIYKRDGRTYERIKDVLIGLANKGVNNNARGETDSQAVYSGTCN